MKHEIYPMRASEDGELLPPVVVEVPDVLYLQVVDTDDCEDWPAPSEPDERTFCYERINESDVPYVLLARAERAEAEAAHYRAQLSAAEEAALECQREAAALRADLDAVRAGWLDPDTQYPADRQPIIVLLEHEATYYAGEDDPTGDALPEFELWGYQRIIGWRPLPTAPDDGGEEG